jgi:hypothetical protein
MSTRSVFRRVIVASLLIDLVRTAVAWGASDPRFFGEYCGTYRERRSGRIIGIFRASRTITFTIRAHVDYREPEQGNGAILGDGTVHWDNRTSLFVFHGDVTAPGRVEGSGTSAALRQVESATATLDPDGDHLLLRAFGRDIHLSKRECSNTPPTATIVSPAAGTTPAHTLISQEMQFEGTATDAEDTAIPWTRFVWTSDREGLLGRGPQIQHTLTGYGRHMITLTVTDHGGLSSTATTEVDVLNRPPQPTILRPLATDGPFYAGAPILFRGIARDLDVGYIRGVNLEWTASGFGEPIGTGQSFIRTMSEGPHIIAFLARDGNRARAATTNITVLPAPRSTNQPSAPNQPSSRPFNSRPSVRIIHPIDQSEVLVSAGGCVVFFGTARDREDGTGPLGQMSDNVIHWEDTVTVRVLGGPGDSRRREFDKGNTGELCSPSLGSHDVIARVTDSGGLTATDTIHLIVQRMPSD